MFLTGDKKVHCAVGFKQLKRAAAPTMSTAAADLPASCREIRARYGPESALSGAYWMRAGSSGAKRRLLMHCDMDSDGGGYSMYALAAPLNTAVGGLKDVRAACASVGLTPVSVKSAAHLSSIRRYVKQTILEAHPSAVVPIASLIAASSAPFVALDLSNPGRSVEHILGKDVVKETVAGVAGTRGRGRGLPFVSARSARPVRLGRGCSDIKAMLGANATNGDYTTASGELVACTGMKTTSITPTPDSELWSFAGASPEACQTQCRVEAGCVGFTWRKQIGAEQTSHCFFFSKAELSGGFVFDPFIDSWAWQMIPDDDVLGMDTTLKGQVTGVRVGKSAELFLGMTSNGVGGEAAVSMLAWDPASTDFTPAVGVICSMNDFGPGSDAERITLTHPPGEIPVLSGVSAEDLTSVPPFSFTSVQLPAGSGGTDQLFDVAVDSDGMSIGTHVSGACKLSRDIDSDGAEAVAFSSGASGAGISESASAAHDIVNIIQDCMAENYALRTQLQGNNIQSVSSNDARKIMRRSGVGTVNRLEIGESSNKGFFARLYIDLGGSQKVTHIAITGDTLSTGTTRIPSGRWDVFGCNAAQCDADMSSWDRLGSGSPSRWLVGASGHAFPFTPAQLVALEAPGYYRHYMFRMRASTQKGIIRIVNLGMWIRDNAGAPLIRGTPIIAASPPLADRRMDTSFDKASDAAASGGEDADKFSSCAEFYRSGGAANGPVGLYPNGKDNEARKVSTYCMAEDGFAWTLVRAFPRKWPGAALFTDLSQGSSEDLSNGYAMSSELLSRFRDGEGSTGSATHWMATCALAMTSAGKQHRADMVRGRMEDFDVLSNNLNSNNPNGAVCAKVEQIRIGGPGRERSCEECYMPFHRGDASTDTTLRLTGGPSSREGRLEMRTGGDANGDWVRVCKRGSWGDGKNANVACKQMGYDSGVWLGVNHTDNKVDYSHTNIAANQGGAEFQCDGDEAALSDCPGWNDGNASCVNPVNVVIRCSQTLEKPRFSSYYIKAANAPPAQKDAPDCSASQTRVLSPGAEYFGRNPTTIVSQGASQGAHFDGDFECSSDPNAMTYWWIGAQLTRRSHVAVGSGGSPSALHFFPGDVIEVPTVGVMLGTEWTLAAWVKRPQGGSAYHTLVSSRLGHVQQVVFESATNRIGYWTTTGGTTIGKFSATQVALASKGWQYLVVTVEALAGLAGKFTVYVDGVKKETVSWLTSSSIAGVDGRSSVQCIGNTCSHDRGRPWGVFSHLRLLRSRALKDSDITRLYAGTLPSMLPSLAVSCEGKEQVHRNAAAALWGFGSAEALSLVSDPNDVSAETAAQKTGLWVSPSAKNSHQGVGMFVRAARVTPPASCKHIKRSNPAAPSGHYWIAPRSARDQTVFSPLRVWCDMDDDWPAKYWRVRALSPTRGALQPYPKGTAQNMDDADVLMDISQHFRVAGGVHLHPSGFGALTLDQTVLRVGEHGGFGANPLDESSAVEIGPIAHADGGGRAAPDASHVLLRSVPSWKKCGFRTVYSSRCFFERVSHQRHKVGVTFEHCATSQYSVLVSVNCWPEY